MSDGMPPGLGVRGQETWKQVLAQDSSLADELAPNRQVALEACRTADLLDRFEKLAAGAAPMIEGRTGPIANPVFVEIRQQRKVLAGLLASLRMPDQATGRKPQRRDGSRGSYPRQDGNVSSLDRARARAGA